MANKSNNKVANKDVKKNSKDKRHFMKDFKAELKKVIWPTSKQLFNNTAAVITIVLILTIIVFILDLGFETINSKGINKLRTVINNNTTQNVIENNSVENSTEANVTEENTTNSTNNTSNEIENSIENTAE